MLARVSLWTDLAAAPPSELPQRLAALRWPDLGLSLAQHLPARSWANLRPHASETSEVGLFFLPRGERIPLHDHPDMHVYMRVLHGTLHVTSYTRVTADLARRTADQDLDETSPVWLVEPHRDNLHTLHARTDVAFLDVLRPPYVAGRVCTYYTATPAAEDLWYLHAQR
jgi:hypothetical protein